MYHHSLAHTNINPLDVQSTLLSSPQSTPHTPTNTHAHHYRPTVQPTPPPAITINNLRSPHTSPTRPGIFPLSNIICILHFAFPLSPLGIFCVLWTGSGGPPRG